MAHEGRRLQPPPESLGAVPGSCGNWLRPSQTRCNCPTHPRPPQLQYTTIIYTSAAANAVGPERCDNLIHVKVLLHRPPPRHLCLRRAAQAPPRRRRAARALPPGLHRHSAARPLHRKIEIDLDVRKPTDIVWLNARDLTIDTAQLTAGGRTLAVKVQTSGTEFAGFAIASAIPAGPAQLRIQYHGAFNKIGSDGLFKEQDAGTWYVYSQFESIDARRAFPCFDEPNFKTPWQLTLHVNKSDAAVSNTPVQSETDEPGGRKKVVFGETKPLPSYLVALGVGPFEFVDAGKAGKNHTPLRMITPKGKAAQSKYAAE